MDVIAGISGKLQAKHIIVMQPEGTVPEGMLNYYDLLASGGEQEPDVDIREGDLVGLAQTGGTTGLPKGRSSSTAI